MSGGARVTVGELRRDEPMDRHVSWRAGGRAARFYVPRHRLDLLEFLADRPRDERLFVLGLGSNLLVRDGGLEATVVQMHGGLREIDWENLDPQGSSILEVEAGVAAPKIARWVARAGMAGGEFLAGIPGTLGGALAMNAGCYGAEIWSFVESVTTLDRWGRVRTRERSEFEVGYRHVTLREARGDPGEDPVTLGQGAAEWFLSARLSFVPGEAAQSQQRIRALLERRVAEQPLGQPNAGSVFRNPPGDHAARLIETSGLKGQRIGGAEVSTKHANFIVNCGTATATDIEHLIQRVQEQVHRRHGVVLQPEVRVVGHGI